MFESPYPPYDPTDKSGFSYETVVKRWPVILTGIIDTIYKVDHELGVSLHTLPAGSDEVLAAEEKIKEGKGIIEKISKLKYDMARDRPLELIPQDGEAYVKEYNEELERLAQDKKNTWFTAPWLFAECYLYRLLRSYLTETKHWLDFDPFSSQKQETFRSSGKAIYQLATTIHDLEVEKDILRNDPEKLAVLFKEMIQMCLWGNATDLSLLTHMTHDDIATLQTVGKDAQAARREFILKDDQDKVIKYLENLKGKDARVDFVLDNAGFELFTDFVFADFLVTYTPYVSRVVFHPKLIPWFVSDVTPPDFASTTPALLSESFFPAHQHDAAAGAAPSGDAHAHLRTMVARWQAYLASGVFQLSVPLDTKLGAANPRGDFWTGPWPYWNVRELAPGVWEELRKSSLVIFKGDLNYRKLTGDVRWPVSTPFEEAVGPLAGELPILSLRTNKADVVVGVPQDVADKLDAAGEKWRVNGKYALVSFLPRTD
ncbi:protein-glutamate O-methyltransferase family protein [Phanerochaete sordida]|uniref:Sugar phosphate phosphatase n=1 Tax=Phanerochaete sordida TaxID=48140 RepID=A0A9P3G6N5_9APHY|nr:protein-glutamate O-methyltransferase family protein [Phanerochaete sordida]